MATASRDRNQFLQSFSVVGSFGRGKRSFTYAEHEGKKFFSFTDQTGLPVIRIDDGSRFLKHDGSSLTVHAAGGGVQAWRSLSVELTRFECPEFEGRRMTVAERLDWLASMIEGGETSEELQALHDAISSGMITVSLRKVENTAEISLSSKKHRANPRFSMSLALDKNACLSRWLEQDGAKMPSQWDFSSEIRNEFSEVVPGVWFLKHGECRITDTGTAASQSGRVQSQSFEIDIDRVDIPNLLATSKFGIDALQVPPGTVVEDYRTDPPTNFTYASGEIDVELLAQRTSSIPEITSVGKPRTWILVVLLLQSILLVTLIIRKVLSKTA